jgi:hypothetical protein
MAAIPLVLNYWFSGSVDSMLAYLVCILSWLAIMPMGWIWFLFLELPSITCGKEIIRRIERRQTGV